MKPDARRWVQCGAGFGLLALAGMGVAPIQDMRRRHELTAAAVEQVASPDLALPLLLAVGRAPAVDYLWLRATRLKEEGRFFDAMQLSSLICTLQPRFAAVWAFHAWNMAYNISVTMESAEERWQWVQNGIALLRDKGIPLNPHSTQLYRELAWIYFHKVADFMDEKHWYYKNEFALLMEDILGPGGACDWEAMAAAPRDWETLVKDREVAEFVAAARAAGLDVASPGALVGALNQQAAALASDAPPPEPPPAWAVLNDPRWAAAVRRVEAFWRAKRLRDEVKVEAARVLSMRKELGPLDFRLAEAHAMYWARLGLEMGVDRAVRLDVEKLNTNRIELYCLQNLYRRGKLILSPEARLGVPPLLMPDTRFVKTLFDIYIESSKSYLKDHPEEKGPIAPDFESAFKNFLRDAIVRCYEMGDMDQARHYFDWIRTHYDHEDFQRGLDAFVMMTVISELRAMTTYQAIGRVTALIRRGLIPFAYGTDTAGLVYLRLARRVHDQYNQETSARSVLPPFDEMVKAQVEELRQYLRPESYARLVRRFGAANTSTAPAGGASE